MRGYYRSGFGALAPLTPPIIRPTFTPTTLAPKISTTTVKPLIFPADIDQPKSVVLAPLPTPIFVVPAPTLPVPAPIFVVPPPTPPATIQPVPPINFPATIEPVQVKPPRPEPSPPQTLQPSFPASIDQPVTPPAAPLCPDGSFWNGRFCSQIEQPVMLPPAPPQVPELPEVPIEESPAEVEARVPHPEATPGTATVATSSENVPATTPDAALITEEPPLVVLKPQVSFLQPQANVPALPTCPAGSVWDDSAGSCIELMSAPAPVLNLPHEPALPVETTKPPPGVDHWLWGLLAIVAGGVATGLTVRALS
jgi:hypothetical protein